MPVRKSGPPAIKKPAPYEVDLSDADGRKPSRAGSATRKKILDAAERLFADAGYDGTSLRDISEASESHLALSTYHFGTKEQLFDEVIRRRAIELEGARLAGLARIDLDAQPPAETVRMLIEAYSTPMIQARFSKSAQWEAYVRLIAGMANTGRWTSYIRKHYDKCAQIYVASWKKVLPKANPDSLLHAFSFMVVTTLYVCSYTNRFEEWEKGGKRTRNERIKVLTDDLFGFVHAGFMAL